MKLLLNIQSGSLAGRRFELNEGFLTMGRGETCSVRFDPVQERIASKQHCFIEAKPDGFYLIDNQSTNGTLLNGQRIQTAKLNSGDTIQFGKSGVEAKITLESQPETNQPTIVNQDFLPPTQIGQIQISPASYTPPTPPPNNWRNSMSNFGLQNPVVEPEKSQTGKYVGVGIAIFAIVFLSLIVVGIMLLSIGPVAAVIAAVIAFVPAMFYILPLIWLDRYDPEPLWLLALAFAWGALVSVIFSFVVNTVLGAVGGEIVGGVISAPVFEEGSKGLGVVLLLVFFRRYFDDILDGVIFAGVIALGFATVENVLYYGRGLLDGSIVFLIFVRGILSPFAHVTFTSMTGIGCGISRESHNPFVRILLPIMGYGCAVMLHALWNGMAFLGGLGGFVLGYIFLEVPFFLIFVGFTIYIMYRQNKILKEMLAIDVARGMIPAEHLETATSLFSSLFWTLGGITDGKYKARRNYLRAIGKLGLTYWHIQRANAAQGQTGSFQQNPILRDEVIRWRDQV
ncbi:MAG: PrsW family glutamic-type intramembrane protease [Acidobacteriota bacterium]|nr:PrsW family glutamic-type intramembrane protease [Acidobacteriota bacterium]